ncbi:MAG TPA: class I SAM-dependent methyltransferase, partial [Verrucomicrobiae bacterium]|nr:class I SAM-dependent methyltransferase [Verrucomicrobiae bacterium]
VLRPGGTILALEISRPASCLLRLALRSYMQIVLPVLVRFRTNKPEITRLLHYYWATIDQCVSPGKILAELNAVGFRNVERRTLGPMLSDYFAQK